jgi:DNA-binding beta-propeller fold protein YncE
VRIIKEMLHRLIHRGMIALVTAGAAAGVLWTLGGTHMESLAGSTAGMRIRAADFRGVDAWLNTDRPIRLADLRGQVVLLDFWTYCCINCMHVFPDLRYLEEKYAKEPFVVIGVHSGKFSQEKDAANIRQATLRHNIAHPVAVDSDYEVWNTYGVQAWPTLVLIDPEGYVVSALSGEGHRKQLDEVIGKLLSQHRAKGTLGQPIQFRAERESFQDGVLAFPGKVLVDPEHQRLFISDTNHHRILVADPNGKVSAAVGCGRVGLEDGPASVARFHQPQGLALSDDGHTLYVADTENHAIRSVDLVKMEVRTIAGTGKQSYDYHAAGAGPHTALSSPWDLARVGNKLYIAMAGTHQIWVLDLKTEYVSVFAGTGREARIDGPNARAGFAQPSGLTIGGKYLYVADSEISSIRAVELNRTGRTSTVAGSGGLFDFGAVDGVGSQARFQHPLGVDLAGRRLYVADTFNHLVREIDLDSKQVSTVLGTGRPEPGTESAIGLYEPGGLSIGGSTLYIADTNHHRILAVDLVTRRARVLDVRLPATTTEPAIHSEQAGL